MAGRNIPTAFVLGLILPLCINASSQTQTTGRIAGTVKDARGAFIASADVVIENPATADKRSLATDTSGNYSIVQLSPGYYDINIRAPGFTPAVFRAVAVGLSETTTINVILQIGRSNIEITVNDTPPPIRSDGAELASTINARSLETLPLPTRNLLQLLTLAPGVTAPLTNNSAIGRNSPNVSVNGSRVTQNSYQINGVDANDISLHDLADVAVPAPETVSDVNVQTSLYDSSVAGAGGSVQVVTKGGSNFLHGSVYEYFRNEAFNADDANLKAVGKGRPEMRRNVYGACTRWTTSKEQSFLLCLLSRHPRSQRCHRSELIQKCPDRARTH